MYAALADAIESAASDEGTRVLVFQGHESIFQRGQ